MSHSRSPVRLVGRKLKKFSCSLYLKFQYLYSSSVCKCFLKYLCKMNCGIIVKGIQVGPWMSQVEVISIQFLHRGDCVLLRDVSFDQCSKLNSIPVWIFIQLCREIALIELICSVKLAYCPK